MQTRKRLSLTEYGTPVDLSRAIMGASGLDRTAAANLLIEAGNRVASSLRLNYNPISVSPNGSRAIDFAGLIRLTPSLELEVVPKFLGLDESDTEWREDFFFLSILSKHGRLLSAERLSTSRGAPRDLSTLVARSISIMYEDRKRRPLRSYRKSKETDFIIDGEPDPLDLIFPSSDGFEQDVIRFDRQNSWNADILGASKELLPHVRDPLVVNSLIRLINDLSPQRAPGRTQKPISSRHSSWKPLHELAIDVLNGLGLNYKLGYANAPGYLVGTWRVWEDLLSIGVRLGYGQSALSYQKGFFLGEKVKYGRGRVSKLSVYPDCVIEADKRRPRFILDAKYKSNIEKESIRISESDIYEAIAFSMATDCNLVVLGYPALPYGATQPAGTCNVFERVNIGDLQIVGVQIESRGISKSGALRSFSSNIVNGFSSIFA